MIASHQLMPQANGIPHHTSAQEWEAYVRSYPDERYRKHLRHTRKQFVEQYPDLSQWFEADLAERVGRLYEERKQGIRHNPFCKASYEARGYLVYLALQGYACFDWDWLLAVQMLRFEPMFAAVGVEASINRLVNEALKLGYRGIMTNRMFQWLIHRIVLHTADLRVEHITDSHLVDLAEALDRFAERPDVALFYGSVEHYQKKRTDYLSRLHQLHVVLYHCGQVKTEPRMRVNREHTRVFVIHNKPQMKQTLQRYVSTRLLTDSPMTVYGLESVVRQFVAWLEHAYPEVETFAQVTREMALEYIQTLNTRVGVLTKRPLAIRGKHNLIRRLAQFFRDGARWEWTDVPRKPLLQEADMPKLPVRIPRYIPDDELERLMKGVRALDCPYQRAALLIARWSGARRGEIRGLAVDCLDSYPDGTPRLRIPAGKTRKERLVPINEEAAEAIRVLQAFRKGENGSIKERGFRDPLTGVVTRYLFIRIGQRFSLGYLFDTALQKACAAAGLVTVDGKPTISAHRFRHTVGTQLARRGARFRTIQKILGHESAAMSMVYIDLTDKDVREDYLAVLGPNAMIAGPGAELVRAGELDEVELNWIKSNFLKTELELGRCLRLPQEGPCECELYLTCAKFVTTPEYAPRLRRRRRIEQDLVEDAAAHGWQREIERHQCTIRRLEQLLVDLGEPLDGPEAID